MKPRNRQRIVWCAVGLAWTMTARAAEPLFSDVERSQIMAYWASPGRYLASTPKDAQRVGVWQVRLTPAGSIWLWGLTRGRKIPPSQTASTPWESWIAAKVRHDRWQALATARRANFELLGTELPNADPNTPLIEPPLPGPMPLDLQASYGTPPIFAEAVAPLRHTVVFDDLRLSYQDNTRMAPRYAYYRFPAGVQSAGVPVRTMEPDALTRLFRLAEVTDSQAKIMRAVSLLEGGFDSVNTYDTGYVSVGFIQFASLKDGGGSLGGVLRNYKAIDPLGFATDFHRFGIEVDEAGALVALDPTSGAEARASDANGRIIEDKRLIAVFQRAGQISEGFRAAQIRVAKGAYWPSEDRVTVTLAGQPTPCRVGELIASEAGLATLFDRKVNTGSVEALGEAATRLAMELGLTTVEELRRFEKTLVAMVKYRKDYLNDPSLSQPAEPPKSRPKSSASRGTKTPRGAVRGHRPKG